MMNILALIDGEHYPSVIEDTLHSIGDVKAAVFLGGTEKIGRIEELTSRITIPVYVAGHVADASDIISKACTQYKIEQVVDLSDAPVVNDSTRFRIACTLMKKGIQYRGSDFLFTPLSSPKVLKRPSLAVSGMTKRVGKTAISGFIARTLKEKGYIPCIVTMGRGGPAEPEVIEGDSIKITPSYLLEQADSGKHAASDHWEHALISRVTTVGCRRCGGGMAGVPFLSNVTRGAEIANTLDVTFIIMEGSGVTIPPVATDAHIVVVGAHQPVEAIEEHFGPYRISIADLVVLMMCEEPMASPEKVETMEKAIDRINPGIRQAHCVFRPAPLDSIEERKVFLATTAPSSALETKIVPYLEQNYHCHVVAASPYLSDRSKLLQDLSLLPLAEVLLTEIKASAIDVAVREALKRGIDCVFMDNVPHLKGGNIKSLQDAVIQLAREVSV